MSLIQSVLSAVRSWRRRRGGPKARKRADVAVERLDHRQLMSVNFTGNVATDFITPSGTGYVRLPGVFQPPNSNPDRQALTPDMALENEVLVSGFALESIWVSYVPADDTLNIGLEQPVNGRTGQRVIAGDADNNLNSATTNPAVQLIDPAFLDIPDLLAGERMAAFLDLNQDAVPDIVAGFPEDLSPTNPPAAKPFRVAEALPGPPGSVPGFGMTLPQYTGSVFLVNDPAHPNLEFQIKDFAGLYLAETGEALNPNSVISIGAFAGSITDGSYSDSVINLKSFIMGDVIRPKDCPPLEPPIMVNPHEHRHINTAHPSDVRVYIYGTAGFQVQDIIPSSVRFGGASPILPTPANPAPLLRNINNDKYLDATFFFRGSDLNLPPGRQDAVVTGLLTNGQPFESTYRVFVRNSSSYTPEELAAQEARQEKFGIRADFTPFQRNLFHGEVPGLSVDTALADEPDLFMTAMRSRRERVARPAAVVRPQVENVTVPTSVPTGPTVRIPLRPGRGYQQNGPRSFRIEMPPETVVVPTAYGRSVGLSGVKVDVSRAQSISRSRAF